MPALLKRFRQSVLATATSGRLTEDWRELNPSLVDASSLLSRIRSEHSLVGGHKKGNASAPTEDVHLLSVEDFPAGWALTDLRELVDPSRPITGGILMPGPEKEFGPL